ncbi:MAG: aspartate kinase, partial [Bryobacteraceae bacterium]
MDNLLLMKFGGTSVGSAERMRVAASLSAAQRQERPVVIVVSAMSKVTDLLLETLRRAETGDQTGVDSNLEELRRRHRHTCLELLPERQHAAVLGEIEGLIGEFERIANGIRLLAEAPPRSVDEAVAIGERLSALLLAARLRSGGTPARAVDAAQVIVTDAVFGNATPLMEPTRVRARRLLLPMLEEGVLPVVTGFNGATADGRPT